MNDFDYYFDYYFVFQIKFWAGNVFLFWIEKENEKKKKKREGYL